MNEDLIRRIDDLEARGQLVLEDLQFQLGGDLSGLVTENVLLVDYRTRLDGNQVTLCRLNRQHPLVKELTNWA